MTCQFKKYFFPLMDFSSQLQEIIKNSPFSVVSLAKKAGIGQSTLYECLRGEYLMSPEKTLAVLDGIGVSSKIKKDFLRIRKECYERNEDRKARRPSQAEKARIKDKIADFFRRSGLTVSNDDEMGSLLVVQIKDNGFPVLSCDLLEDRTQVFGNALQGMLKTNSREILVVTFIVERSTEWEGIEQHGIHLMNPNDALNGLNRLVDGKPLADSSGSGESNSQIFF